MAEGGVDEAAFLVDMQQHIEDQKDELMALDSIFEETGRFHILQTPDEGPDCCFAYQMEIPVKVAEDGVCVELWIPYEQDVAGAEQATSLVPGVPRPEFQRSTSGKRWLTSLQVSHLTPLSLQVRLPCNYPDKQSPAFSLSCLWLSATQLSALCQQLDELWADMAGMPILYTWYDWLENNTLSAYYWTESTAFFSSQWALYSMRKAVDMLLCYLGLEGTFVMSPHMGPDIDGPRDPRALPECSHIEQDIVKLLRYNFEKEAEDFAQNLHECGVCFDEKLGREFFRINECRHHFCRDCLTSYCEVHVSEGTVQKLVCPDPDCKTTLTPTIVQAVLGDEAYNRWERLMLQRALDTMGDILYCPRCNQPVIAEEEEKLSLAHCVSCFYNFCTKCGEAWHQGEDCKSEDVDEDEDGEEATGEMPGRKAATAKAQAQKKQMRKQLALSRELMKRVTKPCPNCKVPIEKNGGCNKVTCTNCLKYMCWLCGKRINGYEHFAGNGGCQTFTAELFTPVNVVRPERPARAIEIEDELIVDPNAHNRISYCPRCHQRNLKEGRNNHVKCWSCKSNFCYLCKTRIEGSITGHFLAGMPCKQHSD